MAEAELTIKYRDRPITVAFWITSVLFPTMCFVVFWTSLVLLANCGQHGMQADRALALIAFNFSLASLCGLVLFLASDSVIFITRDGITLPFFLCPGPWHRVRKKWSDLKSMQYIPARGRGWLKMSFKGGGSATLDLTLVPQKQINELIMALDVWTDGADNFTPLLEARTQLLESAGAKTDFKYTELWQEELSRRFGATNFIPLEPGEKVQDGAYTVEKQLAFGGLSAIYLARKKDQSRVVLKEAVVQESDNPDLLEKSHEILRREAAMLAALSHEQIARVFDHFVDRGRHYLVLEYIQGQDLRALVLEEGPQKEAQVLAWAVSMAQMLSYLHEQPEPIIHRDFTPDNLLLNKDGTIVVIDFGAANFFLGTATGTMIGKQAYIAPEQLRGKATPQSDIYALGCCLYFLSTGADPEPLSVSHPREKVASLSTAFDTLVAQCTQMERQDRPATARAVLDRLKRLKEAKTDAI